MKIFIEKTNKTKTITFNGAVAELLSKLKINKEEVIVIKTDELVTEDQIVSNEDYIKILSVISGG